MGDASGYPGSTDFQARKRYWGNNLFVLALIGGYHIFMLGGANFGIGTAFWNIKSRLQKLTCEQF